MISQGSFTALVPFALAALSLPCAAQTFPAELRSFLDRDRDGTIGRFEGADAWMLLVREADDDGDGGLSEEELSRFFREEVEESEREREELFGELDRNSDGAIALREVPGEMRGVARRADADGDGALDYDEFSTLDLDDPRLLIDAEIEGLWSEVGSDPDAPLELRALPEDLREELASFDTNTDGSLTREEAKEALSLELGGASFEIRGDVAVMRGVIGPNTPARILELVLERPDVRTIQMIDVPGSMDDESNLRAARLVHEHGFTTEVPDGGIVASGGTDFFLAGVERIAGRTARFGVHSWSGFDEEGADLPRSHPEHAKYLEFYRAVGTPEDFYWFTLEAAPADGIHWMTPEELERYDVITGTSDRARAFSEDGAYGLDAIDVEAGSRGVVPLPDSVDRTIRRTFDRYTRVVAPNGRPIHVLAQAAWNEDQIVRARKVLEHILTDVPGSEFGHSKAAVANAMAERRATLVLFEDLEAMERALRGRLGELELGMQDLRANECPVEGDDDYMIHDTRDAAFEEILHLVHDYGIRPALPDFDDAIQEANDRAVAASLWQPWPDDEPDSHRNEYIAAIYDNYLDLWTVPPTRYEGEQLEPGDIPPGSSHFGRYRAGSRARLREMDPDGFALLQTFFPDDLTYVAELPVDFEGTFHLDLAEGLRYTRKSNYLRHVMLRGDNPARIIGNRRDNDLTGNAGDNELAGGGGNDRLDGGAGTDTALFRGNRDEYDVEVRGEVLVVTDRTERRDGKTELRRIEKMSFVDGVVPVRKR